jgi:uncharacterized protein (TIGR02246 family)
MFPLRHFAILAAGLIALAGCAKTSPVADTAADETAIRGINPQWFQAYAAGDADAIAALYAEDAVLSPPGAPPARGRAAIRDYLAGDVAASKAAGVSFNPGPSPEFAVSGDLGWEWNTFNVTDGAGATVDTGKYVTVYARRDGNWVIVRDIWNSDVAPAAATPAAAPVAEAPEATPPGG